MIEMSQMEVKDLDRYVSKRYYRHKYDFISRGLPPIDEDVYRELFFESYKDGGKCHYCKETLFIGEKFPYPRTPSIDHKKPLAQGGDSSDTNLIVCCTQCNIIKGTMSATTYEELILEIGDNKDLRDRMFSEMRIGRLAQKIMRSESEKKMADSELKIIGFLEGAYRYKDGPQIDIWQMEEYNIIYINGKYDFNFNKDGTFEYVSMLKDEEE